jgi:hypothetical protein
MSDQNPLSNIRSEQPEHRDADAGRTPDPLD